MFLTECLPDVDFAAFVRFALNRTFTFAQEERRSCSLPKVSAEAGPIVSVLA
jgi:hypothetical protein